MSPAKKYSKKRKEGNASDDDYVDGSVARAKKKMVSKRLERGNHKADKKTFPSEQDDHRPNPQRHRAASMKPASRKTEVQRLREKNAKLQKQLIASEAEIFRFRPQADESDGQIVDKYNELCMSISRWVVKLLNAAESHAEQTNMLFEVDHLSQHMTSICERFSGSIEFVLSSNILTELQRSILTNDRQLMGIDEGVATLVRNIEAKLSQTGNSTEDKGHWMAQLISHVQDLPSFREQQQDFAKDCTERILTIVGIQTSVPDRDIAILRPELNNVVLETIRLANAFKACASEFRFSPDLTQQESSAPTGRVYLGAFGKTDFRDARTGRRLTEPAQVVASKDKSFGKLLMVVELGVSKLVGEREKSLRNPVKLVELDESLAKVQPAESIVDEDVDVSETIVCLDD